MRTRNMAPRNVSAKCPHTGYWLWVLGGIGGYWGVLAGIGHNCGMMGATRGAPNPGGNNYFKSKESMKGVLGRGRKKYYNTKAAPEAFGPASKLVSRIFPFRILHRRVFPSARESVAESKAALILNMGP